MMKNLTTLPGAPESRTVALGATDDGLLPLLRRKLDVSELGCPLLNSKSKARELTQILICSPKPLQCSAFRYYT
jgi:hypothetical protein